MEMTPVELARTPFRWSGGGAMTFGELREKMLRLGAWLRQEAGVVNGDRVVISLPKSPEGVIAMYGAMAAGGAYSPLHYQGPPDRLNAVLASMNAKVILTTAAMAAQFAGPARKQIVDLRADGTGFEQLTAGIEPLGAPMPVEPEDLAWLIYTSGSTGEPKGVMLSHRAMTANVEAMQRRDELIEGDLRISHAPMHYISAFDLMFPLVSP